MSPSSILGVPGVLAPRPRSPLVPTDAALRRPPSWLGALFAGAEPRAVPSRHDVALQLVERGTLAWLTVTVPGAASLDSSRFQRAVAGAYEELLGCLSDLPAKHPLRLWNFVPQILAPLDDLEHRYFAFNSGRFAAYERTYGSALRFPTTLATASGTGHEGSDFVVHCLSSVRPGQPVENPLQVPAYRYSARYGPRPPCFARATIAPLDGDGASRHLLVGGTASVRGEDSAHPGDLDSQLCETLTNLVALLDAAARAGGIDERPASLDSFRSLRVYYPRPEHRPRIQAAIESRFERLSALELVGCDLCRPELLVEIEGLADLDPS